MTTCVSFYFHLQELGITQRLLLALEQEEGMKKSPCGHFL